MLTRLKTEQASVHRDRKLLTSAMAAWKDAVRLNKRIKVIGVSFLSYYSLATIPFIRVYHLAVFILDNLITSMSCFIEMRYKYSNFDICAPFQLSLTLLMS